MGTPVHKRVVAIALDDSDHSEYTFVYYCQKIHKEGDMLVMIHVPEDTSYLCGAEEKVRQMKEQSERMIRLEKKYMDRLITNRIEGTFRVGMGKPGQVIVRIAREVKADLVIVGTRGQSSARQLILGSVSRFVLFNSQLPVLVCQRGVTLEPSSSTSSSNE